MAQMPSTHGNKTPITTQQTPAALPTATTNAQFAPPPGPMMARDNSIRGLLSAPPPPVAQARIIPQKAGKIPTTGGYR